VQLHKQAVAETWHRVWGDGKFFADHDDVFFLTEFPLYHFSDKHFWWPFFSHRPDFSNFHWFSGSLLC